MKSSGDSWPSNKCEAKIFSPLADKNLNCERPKFHKGYHRCDKWTWTDDAARFLKERKDKHAHKNSRESKKQS